MQPWLIEFNATILGMSFLYSLILLISCILKKNKTMMSAPFIMFCAMVTGLQLVSWLEWLHGFLHYPHALYRLIFVLDFALSYLSSAMFYWYIQTYIYALRHPEKSVRPASERRTFALIGWLGLGAMALFVSSIWTGWFFVFDPETGVEQFNALYPLVFLLGSFWSLANLVQVIRNRRTLTRGQLALILSYILIPVMLYSLYVVLNLALGTVASALTFLLLYTRLDNAQGERLLENKALLAQREAEMTETKMDLMMSQIQPHFLYNALSSIAFLCTEDPAEAERATNEFSSYLRGNLQSIGAKAPIAFEMELQHVEQYLRIEKRRFSDRLNIVYDIRERDFRIPALTLQTLVENAVRYSVTAKYEPTTVTIRSEATDAEYIVRIIDDGPGFDTSAKPSDDRRHIGLSGARYRLAEMLGGRLEVDSVIGQGTTVSIHIPKEERA